MLHRTPQKRKRKCLPAVWRALGMQSGNLKRYNYKASPQHNVRHLHFRLPTSHGAWSLRSSSGGFPSVHLRIPRASDLAGMTLTSSSLRRTLVTRALPSWSASVSASCSWSSSWSCSTASSPGVTWLPAPPGLTLAGDTHRCTQTPAKDSGNKQYLVGFARYFDGYLDI